VAPWALAVGQRIAVARSFDGEPSLAAQQLWAALITAVAIVTRTIRIAVGAPTTVVEFTVAAQSSEAALLFAAELPYVEVARAAEAEEFTLSRGLRGKMMYDGPDAWIFVDWSVNNPALRKDFDDWCMESFNCYAETHTVNGAEITNK
jgi:hypothetical protein